jgi:hypothetical protein
MAEAVEAFAAMSTPKPVSEFLDVNGQFVFRTVYPTIAQEQSCVSCHNALQPDKPQWHLNDVIGAFVIDVPTSAFLRSVTWQSVGIGLGLFLALSLAGLTISLIHFRQLEALDASAAKLGRTQKFLDTIIENMPLSVVGRAGSMPGPDQPHRRNHFWHRARQFDRQGDAWTLRGDRAEPVSPGRRSTNDA